MYDVKLKANTDDLSQFFRDTQKDFPKIIEFTLQRTFREFEAHIIRTQMRGRPGLRVQSGTLVRSWKARPTKRTSDGFKKKFGTSTIYAIFHQKGGKIIPKRLHVYEAFQEKGAALIDKYYQEGINLKSEFGK